MAWILLLAAIQQPTDEEIARLCANVKDYPTKFRLVEIGRPAVAPLLAQLSSNDPWLVFESQSALRWIANRASTDPAEQVALVEHLWNLIATHAFAIPLLGEVGGDRAVVALAPFLREESRKEAALDALVTIPGKFGTGAIAGAVPTARGEFRAKLLLRLGARRDPEFTELLLAERAYEAVGLSGDRTAADALAAAAEEGSADAHVALVAIGEFDRAYDIAKNDEQRAAALAGTNVDRTLQALDTPLEPVALRRLVAIADTGTDWMLYGTVLAESEDPALLIRALIGCGRAGDAESVAVVMSFLRHERPAVAAAAVMALRDIPGSEATIALCSRPSELTIEALGARRDPGAICDLVDIARANEALRPAAIRAMGAIGDRSAVNTLATLAQEGSPEALPALLAIAEASGSAAVYHRAIEVGAGAEALAGLGRVGDRSSVPYVERFLDGPNRRDALTCLVAIADRLEGAEAVELYRRALDLGAPVEDRLRARGERVEITAHGGYVSLWWVVGPFDARGRESWETAEFPEREIDLTKVYTEGGREMRWRSLTGAGERSIIDLDAAYTPNDHVVAYAYAEVVARRETDAVLKLSSDDGVIVWVNGERVHAYLEPRSLADGEDTVNIHLREGANTVLVKSLEQAGWWGFTVRLLDAEGRPLRFKIR